MELEKTMMREETTYESGTSKTKVTSVQYNVLNGQNVVGTCYIDAVNVNINLNMNQLGKTVDEMGESVKQMFNSII